VTGVSVESTGHLPDHLALTRSPRFRECVDLRRRAIQRHDFTRLL